MSRSLCLGRKIDGRKIDCRKIVEDVVDANLTRRCEASDGSISIITTPLSPLQVSQSNQGLFTIPFLG
jgi:hypothetical protein